MKVPLAVLLILLCTASVYARELTILVHSGDDAPDASYKKLGKYISAYLAKDGYTGFRIINDKNGSKADLRAAIASKPDIMFLSQYPAAQAAKQGYLPLMNAMRKGSLYSGAVFFVRRDSRIFRLRDLKNGRVALGKEYSSDLYSLPLRTLASENINVKTYPRPKMEDRASDVFLKKADAAVASSSNLNDSLPDIFKDTFRVIYVCGSIHSMFIMLPETMDDVLRGKIISILINARNNSAGKNALNFSGINDVYSTDFDWKALFSSL